MDVLRIMTAQPMRNAILENVSVCRLGILYLVSSRQKRVAPERIVDLNRFVSMEIVSLTMDTVESVQLELTVQMVTIVSMLVVFQVAVVSREPVESIAQLEHGARTLRAFLFPENNCSFSLE
ncbi:hypothetical protein GCK72_011753 [Caenorhabditis remanei]|uniref:Uncharacterized protein n=1 Tax=Caenorhabditis remanei TaxID=31234 RepID=A0A6A5H8G0_CAERE|nr:hypothetical protein GCK72_011753 [Caenorhabditis remanei]KAF1763487.1 hypothetical protein GCK72_011753 [Caenorhabditis remanei]